MNFCFRDNFDERRSTADADSATRAAIDTLNLIGLGVLCDGRSAFLNCTHQMLLMGYFSLLPPREVVVELQETVPANDQVRAACEGLKQAYASYIKIDVRKYPLEQCAAMVKSHASQLCHMLAFKVETRRDFVNARHCGFTLCQGYFFRQPERLRTRQIPANQAT